MPRIFFSRQETAGFFKEIAKKSRLSRYLPERFSGHNEPATRGLAMAKRGRRVGTGKPPGEKYVLKAFKFPPDLWEAFCAVVPVKERSATIREYVQREIRKRRK
jgi:hypothetical protein